jgi:tRNA-splicing ligase RtcB
MGREVSGAIERLRRAPDVQQIAVMPDVHLAADVCIGVVVASSHLIYPQAVGGDIGCGMLAVGLDLESAALGDARVAGEVLAALSRAVPARRRNRNAIIPQPGGVENDTLSHSSLDSIRRNEGATEFATLGSGNHFIEIQADDEGRLWLMVHSGSRALGPSIRDHHLSRAQPVGGRLRVLDATSDTGAEYLHDASCARRFADASRRAMAEEVGRT